MVLEDFMARCLWQLAKVIEVYSGSGQIDRYVKLKRAFGEKVCFVAKLTKFQLTTFYN